MDTILDYLKKYGRYSFREMPLTEADSVVLCQLSYLKFDGLVPTVRENKASVTLAGLREHPDYEKLFGDTRYEKENRALVEAILAGKRFSHIKMNCYMNLVRKESETQFSALTFILDCGLSYVVFRGTDETLVGWKEDFNMAFLTPIPAQEYSVRYLNHVAGRIYGPLFVGGHSKGGNLAVYSSMNCNPIYQERIQGIYSLDGPGFRPEVLEKCGYDCIADRVVKIIPRESVIGMIFDTDENCITIASRGFGLLQHDLYEWGVEENHLKRVKQLKGSSRRTDMTINKWILSLNEYQIQTFVDTLYQVITASHADNLIDLSMSWKKSLNAILTAMKEVDPETAKVIKKTFKLLFELVGAQLKEQVARSGQNLIDTTRDLFHGGLGGHNSRKESPQKEKT